MKKPDRKAVFLRLLFPPAPVVVLLALVSAGGLAWVFLDGREEHPIAYAVYCLSFYSLVTLTALLPGLIRGVRAALNASPFQMNAQQKFSLHLYLDQSVNMLYGSVKTILGVICDSAWIGADGLYNLAQGVIQLFLILGRKRKPDPLRQWRSYRCCGWMMLGLQLTMTGPIYQMVVLERHTTYPGYMIFLTAMFTFYKVIMTSVRVVRDRRHKAPIDSAARLIDLNQALFNLFSLQVAMLHQFGSSNTGLSLLPNTLTAGGVCLIVFATAVYMIRRARREIQKL